MRSRILSATVVSVAMVALGLVPASAAHAALLPYQDPSLPVATRVNDLLGRMSLDEKLGQMTQAERSAVTNAQITQFRLGSLLSGGGSAPSPNTATGWADMYDNFQNAALATPLGIPLIYGVDAVHGHNNVVGATIFPHNIALGATRDPALVQNIGRRHRRGGLRHRHRLGLSPACAWPATTGGAAPTSRSARRPTWCRR
jgi:beta-glucosidase